MSQALKPVRTTKSLPEQSPTMFTQKKMFSVRSCCCLLLTVLFSYLFGAIAVAAILKDGDLARNGFRDALNYPAIFGARYSSAEASENNPGVDRSFWGVVSNPILNGAGAGRASQYFLNQPNPSFFFSTVVDENILLVVHAERHFDTQAVTKIEIERLQSEFTARHESIVNLYDWFPANDWFAIAEQPTAAQLSHEGENSIRVRSGDVTLVGGFWGSCFAIAMMDIIRQHFWVSSSPLKIILPLSGIYAEDENYQPAQLSVVAGPNRLAKVQEDVRKFLITDFASSAGTAFPYDIPLGANLRIEDYTLHFYDARSGLRSESGTGAKIVNFELR